MGGERDLEEEEVEEKVVEPEAEKGSEDHVEI